ncbi:hypothetical protein ACFL0R_05570 [Pseudomonadota bacterium]
MMVTLTKDKLLEIGEQVQDFRLPSITALYGIHKDRTRPAELLGSGTFVQHKDDVFVLTAYHVVKNSSKYEYILHPVGGGGENMFPLRGDWTGWPEEDGDLALWGCFRERIDTSPIQPIQIVEPFGITNARKNAFFITSGYPADKAWSLPFAREYYTMLHTVMGDAALPDDIPGHCFAINCANDIRYFGMSGSAVWNLNLHRCRTVEEWSPQMSTFAGVTTRWNADEGLLIATKAEVTKEFLCGAIESLRADRR